MSQLVHIWSRCHACQVQPIVGKRFECGTCPSGPDNDLCERCYRSLEVGSVKHPVPGGYAEVVGAALGKPHVFSEFAGHPREASMPWLDVPAVTAAAPSIPDGFVVRPEFCVGTEGFLGGYAFAAQGTERLGPVLLTALHVLSSLTKSKAIDPSAHNAAYSAHALAALVTKVNLFDVFAPNWMISDLGTAGQMLILPDARLGDEEPFSYRDVAAFRLGDSAKVTPAALASAPPTVGEPIWLAVRRDGRGLPRTVEAVVVECTDRTLVFRYPPAAVLPQFTSGAPLVNRAGEVVGLNVGVGQLEGHTLGHANHVGSIRKHLASASLPAVAS